MHFQGTRCRLIGALVASDELALAIHAQFTNLWLSVVLLVHESRKQLRRVARIYGHQLHVVVLLELVSVSVVVFSLSIGSRGGMLERSCATVAGLRSPLGRNWHLELDCLLPLGGSTSGRLWLLLHFAVWVEGRRLKLGQASQVLQALPR